MNRTAITGLSCLIWKPVNASRDVLTNWEWGSARAGKLGSHQSCFQWTICNLLRDASIIPLEQPWDSVAMTRSAICLLHWKRHRRQWLTRSDIPRIVKLILYAVNDNNTDQDVIIKSPRHFQDFDSALYDSQFRSKAATIPTQNDIPNIVAALMQVVLNFLAHRMLLYGQGSLSADLRESQYCC